MFWKKSNKETCVHIYHDVGSYETTSYDNCGTHIDSYRTKYYVLYCENCKKRSLFTSEKERDIELKISEINKKNRDFQESLRGDR